MPSKICCEPGCNRIGAEARCEEHKRPAKKLGQKWEGDPFYNGRHWKRLRKWWIETQEPLCRHCAERGRVVAAVHVDHVAPRSVAPERALDASNLQSLCKPCHSRKTRLEERERA